MEWKDKAIEFLIQNGPTYFWAGSKALLILFAGVLAGRWLSKRVMNLLSRREFEPPVRMLASRLVFLATLAFAAVIALSNLGFNIMALLTGVGVLGVGISLATQGVLSNVVAGLTIIFTKPFRVGEYIDVIGEFGQVAKIELMATSLAQPDRSVIVIPNRKIVGEVLQNYGTIRQVDMTVGIAYDSDINKAFAAIKEVLRDNARVMKELPPMLGISALADSGINLVVKPWVGISDFAAARTEIYQALVEKFRERNVSIPFPQREIRVLNGNGSHKLPA